MSLTSWIAATGENATFVTYMAHMWFAWSVVVSWPHLSLIERVFIAGVVTVVALGKELIFDMRYELNPPQTIADGLRDFAGYVTGAWGAVLFVAGVN